MNFRRLLRGLRGLLLASSVVRLSSAEVPVGEDAETTPRGEEWWRELEPASRQERLFTFTDRPVMLNAVLGFGTPVGLLGAVLEYSVAPALAFGGGFGVNGQGPQLALVTHLRPFYWERRKRVLALAVGGALATGPHTPFSVDLGHGGSGERGDDHYEQVYWGQVDVGFELLQRSGFHLLASLGVAVPIAAEGTPCTRQGNRGAVECARDVDGVGALTVLLGTSF